MKLRPTPLLPHVLSHASLDARPNPNPGRSARHHTIPCHNSEKFVDTVILPLPFGRDTLSLHDTGSLPFDCLTHLRIITSPPALLYVVRLMRVLGG